MNLGSLKEKRQIAVDCQGQFVATDRIKKNSPELSLGSYPCPEGYSESFGRLYLPIVEKSVGKQVLTEYYYPGYGWTYFIEQDLGGSKKAEMTLQEFFAFLKTADGEAHGYGAFIKDIDGKLGLVSAHHRRDGWSFFAAESASFGFAHWHFVRRQRAESIG